MYFVHNAPLQQLTGLHKLLYPTLNPLIHTFICCTTCKVRSECELEGVCKCNSGHMHCLPSKALGVKACYAWSCRGLAACEKTIIAKLWKLIFWRSLNLFEHTQWPTVTLSIYLHRESNAAWQYILKKYYSLHLIKLPWVCTIVLLL